MKRSIEKSLAIALTLAAPLLSRAADVTLTASDGFGASSFNSAGNWSDGLAPHSGATYLVDNGFLLRTPSDGNSYTFGGDSLAIGPNGSNGGGFSGGDFGFKGTGNTGVITVNDLILDGGLIRHINGVGDVFTLAGNLDVAANSEIYAKQGQINITANISGSATITDPGSDDATGEFIRRLTLSSPNNTFTGDIVLGNTGNPARFELASGGLLNFVIGADGVNNSVSGTGIAQFNGSFNFDLSGAGAGLGDSWTVANATGGQTFGSGFSINGFTQNGSLWDDSANGVTYQFDTGSGILSVVPEPTSLALDAMGLMGLLALRRRRQTLCD